jgi:hypothetical protein
MDTILAAIREPEGLSEEPLALWRAVVGSYDLRPDELAVLRTICRTVDVIEALETAMIDQPLVVTGHGGQVREHPMISETRMQRLALGRLITILHLPNLDNATGQRSGAGPGRSPMTRTDAGRKAANARWHP